MDSTYTNKDICFYSFNSRGFHGDKQDICKLLTLKNDSNFPILCNQENFLLQNNGYKVKQCLTDPHIFFKKAVMESTNGRPKFPKEIKESVKDISPTHWRTQGVIVHTLECDILVINSYFPSDPKMQNFDAADLLSTLDVINEVLNTNKFDHVVWAGDLNADFYRNIKLTLIIDQFIKERYLSKSWDKFQVDFTHVTENNGKTFTSIYYFCWNAGMDNNVVDAGVLHLPQNMSDHSPVFLIMKVHGLLSRTQFPPVTHAKLNWKKTSQEQRDKYRMSLENNLKSLEIPDCCEKCFNVHCKNVNHNKTCDEFLTSLLNSVEDVAKECIPYSGGNPHLTKKKPLLAKWNDEVRPFKDKALFWHAVWQSAGKPINTQLHGIMK